jgi:hypothetical protein
MGSKERLCVVRRGEVWTDNTLKYTAAWPTGYVMRGRVEREEVKIGWNIHKILCVLCIAGARSSKKQQEKRESALADRNIGNIFIVSECESKRGRQRVSERERGSMGRFGFDLDSTQLTERLNVFWCGCCCCYCCKSKSNSTHYISYTEFRVLSVWINVRIAITIHPRLQL